MVSDDKNVVIMNKKYQESKAFNNVVDIINVAEDLNNVAETQNDAVADLNYSLEVDEVGRDILMNEEFIIQENKENPTTNRRRKPRGKTFKYKLKSY